MSFKSVGISEILLKSLKQEGFKKPFPIQEKAIPAILKGKDLLGIAKTGSGKTASFVLPILMNINKSKPLINRHPKVLVIVPTRELCVQIRDVFKTFSMTLADGPKSFAVFGGVSINPQMIGLQNVSILVATPGRLLDLISKNSLYLDKIETLVIDEADKILNIGFKDELNQIIKLLPKKRQNLLFSATLNDDIDNISSLILEDPSIIKIESEKDDLELINQKAYYVSPEKKGPLLRYLIESENLSQVLIFTSSIQRADRVADKLRKNGIEAWPIHSRKSQGARTDLLTKFKHGKLRVLVATDLLSRGIDIDFLPYVINYELPRSPKDYIHRIGRTGRAESSGVAISLITPEEQHHFEIIQKKMKKWVQTIEWDDNDLY